MKNFKKFKINLEEASKFKPKAGAALFDYGNTSGGINKKDIHYVAAKLTNFAKTGNPGVVHQAAKYIHSMNTTLRNKVMSIIDLHDPAMHNRLVHKMKQNKKESVELEEDLNEGVSNEAKSFMKDFNNAVKMLKDDVKMSDKNDDWKQRLKYISNMLKRVK